MELVWKTFRPVTAKNLQQLERSVAVRSLADRFDSLRWSSGSSVQELCSLRQSIERVHWAIESSSSHNFGPLEVCLLRAHERLFLLTESKDIQKILGNLRSCTEVLKDEVTPYFQCDFKILLQFDACTRDLGSMESKLELSLLAGRSTAQLIRFGIPSNSSEVLSHFQRVAGTGQPNTELAAIRNVLPVSMLHKLYGPTHSFAKPLLTAKSDCVSEVPLRSLNRLCAEMDIISKNLAIYSDTICGNALQFLNHLLIRVREKVSELCTFIRSWGQAHLP